MVDFYSNVYINNLTPGPVSLTVSTTVSDGDWSQLQTSLQPFDGVNHEVLWVSRNTGISDGDTYSLLIQVGTPGGTEIVTANIGLKGTFAGSDITIGAQNRYFTNTGHSDDGPYTNTWTDANQQTWAVEFDYLPPNASLYDDVIYNFFMTVPGQGA